MTAPIPTSEAVEALARAMWTAGTTPESLGWDDVSADVKHRVRTEVLDVLVPAYPQIVADVLDWAADQAEDPVWSEGPITPWLRARADEVRP